MILHRLEVGGFRCFSSKVTLTLESENINILHGKNGSGKSSLLWALIRGLLDSHRAGGKGVGALRPWGTDLGPTIAVEFEDHGRRYRLEKSFLENRRAHLAERQGAKFKPLADDDKAEQRVREILLSEVPTVGLTKPEKWGLARALWCPQEHLLVEGFDGRVLSSIQELLGKQAMNEEALALKGTVEKRYLEYWTPQGKPKGGKDAPLWVRRQADLSKLEESLSECTRDHEDMVAAQETAQTLHEERELTADRLDQSKKALSELQTRVSEYAPLVERCGKLEAQYHQKQAEARALDAAIRQVADLREREERAQTRLRELDEKIQASSLEEGRLQRLLREAEQTLQSFESGDPKGRSLGHLLEEATTYMADRHQLTALQRRLQEIARLDEIVRDNTEVLNALAAPDDGTLSTLEHLTTKQVQLQTQLEGSLLHVQLTPRAGCRIEVLQGSPPGPRHLGASEHAHVSGSPTVELVIEGFGRMKVTGPQSSASEIEQKLGQVTKQIEGITTRYGWADLVELKNRRKRATVLEAEIAGAANSREQLLEGQTAEGVQTTASRLQQEALRIEECQPAWRHAPPDTTDIKRQLEEATEAFERRRAEATQQWKNRQKEMGDVSAVLTAYKREQEQLSKQSIENREKLLRFRADGLSDADRLQRFQSLAVEAVGFEQKHKEEAERLKRMGEDPRPLLQQAEKDQEAAQKAFQKCDGALREHQGALKKLLDRAPYERCAHLEEEMQDIRGRLTATSCRQMR